jgi:hypothetical protein
MDLPATPMRATHVALAGNTNTARAVACLLSCRPRSSRSSTTRPGPGTRSVPGSEAPPVARCWVSMDGDGEEPAPSRVWTPAFAPKSRSLGRVGQLVLSHGSSHTQPNRLASTLQTLQACQMWQQNGTKSQVRLVPSYHSTHHRTQENGLHPFHRGPRGCFT